MNKQKKLHKMLAWGGGCKVLLTLALLMLLSVVTAGKAAAQDPQAYAVLEGNTLTFYYDDGYSEGENTWAFPSSGFPGWENNTNITKVEITKDFHNFTPVSCEKWFYCLTNLTEIIGIENINTSEVMNMDDMFFDCESLTSLDLSSFNTASVQSMENIFSGCSALATIFIGKNWIDAGNTDDLLVDCATNELILEEPYAVLEDNGTTLRFWFGPDGSKPEGAMELTLPTIQFGTYIWPWSNDQSNITKVEFDNMFRYARPESCAYWFAGFTNLKEIIGIENLNTSEVKDMSNMFSYCKALTSLDLSSFNTASVQSMSGMFSDCSALTSLDLSSFNTASVLSMSHMFSGCSALTSLDLSSFNTASVQNMSSMFMGCSALTTILVDNLWKIKDGASGNFMFHGCENLVGGNGTTYLPEQITGIEYAIIDDKDNDNPGYLTSIDQCEPYAMLKDNYQTLKFCYGYKPEEDAMDLDYSYWENNASNITKVVFDPLFKYASPTSCTDWFKRFTNLTEIIGIGNLNTSKVKAMSNMFDGCEKLTSLDLSSFNTAEVKDMSGMFLGCHSLTSLDLSSFNTASVQFMHAMFNGCVALTTILVDRNLWKIGSNCKGTNMFFGCNNLVGGNGTKYKSSNTDKTYAIVDGNGGEGYLTHNALKLTKSNGKTTAELYGDIDGGIGAAVSVDKETKVSQVTFHRSFTQGVTATVMFPFSFTADDKIKGTFRTVSKVAPDDNGVWTAELSYPITEIQANTPYIFSPSGDIESITFTGENGNGITLLPVTGDLTNGANDGWQLHGVYSKKIWTEDSKPEYGFAGEEADGIKAGEFVRAGKGAWADPMRCYLTYEGNGNPFTTKAATVLPDRIRVVFPEDKDEDTGEEITTDPDEVITPVSPVTEEAVTKVWAYNRTIFIESPTGSEYTVIDITGRQIKASTTESTHEEINVSKPGVYVVIIGGKSYKLWLN